MVTPFDPIQRPGLAYRHAFDWLANSLAGTAEPTTCLVHSTFHGTEVLRRLPRIAFLVPLPAGLEAAGKNLGIAQVNSSPGAGGYKALAWLEPLAGDGDLLPALRKQLQPQGSIYLVISGYLGRFLAEQRLVTEKKQRMSCRQVTNALEKHGFIIEERVGWHGFAAIAWHYLGQMATGIGRLDWRDRCHYAMRRSFVEDGPGHQLVALSGIRATMSA